MGQNSHFLLLLAVFITSKAVLIGGASDPEELLIGFIASPNPSVSAFQPFLTDSTGNYSFGFLRLDKTQLSLAVIHVASSETIWQASMARIAKWSNPTQIIFNGSLVLSDSQLGEVLWSTYTKGDRVFLSNSSNLQIQKFDNLDSPIWQSFDFPTNTLVENQNFTSNMSLVSSNGLYSMQLGSDFMALYGKFQPGSYPGQIYWKHRALDVKAPIIPGPPIYLVVKSDGFLGMYQNGSVPVGVQSFSSFQQPISGVRRVRLEPDGNLKGYFWTGSTWVLDYQAIADECQLPSACGPYGLCKPGNGCYCLNNDTQYNSGGCSPPGNQDSGDFCGEDNKKFNVLQTNGVELPYKELMSYHIMESFNQCQGACQDDCTCWGAVYSNTSGNCYMLEYPIQTLVSVKDVSKLGYFKIRVGARKQGKVNVGLGVGMGILCLIVLVLGVGSGLWWYRFRKRKRGGRRGNLNVDGHAGIGPYKDLEHDDSMSIELPIRWSMTWQTSMDG